MAKKVVTLYIDDTGIRLLVTQGKRIKKWATLPLEPGLINNAIVTRQEETASLLKQFLKEQKESARKVAVGISGLTCLTRPLTLPQLPKEMREEAIKREAKRLLPIPPEQLYISWQTIPSPDENLRAFLIAVPHKTADPLLETLHKAGLKPDLLDLKPMALAKMVKESTAIVVDVQPTEFDIVIMSDGVAQPVRTVSFPTEASSWDEQITIIRNELDRTIQFFNSNNPQKPLDDSTSIFVSGRLTAEEGLCQDLSKDLGFPVLPLPSPLLTCPEGFNPHDYMVNISLAMEKLTPNGNNGSLVTNLNALPASYRPKPISLVRVIVLPCVIVAFALLVPLIINIQGSSTDISSMQAQLDTTGQLLQLKMSQRQKLTEQVAELNKIITEEEKAYGIFTTMLNNIETQSGEVNGDLEATITCLPQSIRLTNISHAKNTLTISGIVPDEQDILTYLRELEDTGRFHEITISIIKKVEVEDAPVEAGEGEEETEQEPAAHSEREFIITLGTGEAI